MSRRLVVGAVLSAVAAAVLTAGENQLRVTGPFTHDNLAIYLLHGRGEPGVAKLLALGDAIEQKKAAVYETGNVQELAIENFSTEPVFVQAGDIVKGGRQDRVLTTDLLLPPKSGKLSIASFCVEQGRWTKRGAEPVLQFNAAMLAAPTKELKNAMREPGNQEKVWAYVAEARTKLAESAGGVGAGVVGGVVGGTAGAAVAPPPPAPAARATSMQLALEDKKITVGIDRYVTALQKIELAGAIGYAYSVNGAFSGADVYGSADLFRRMWPKLLKTSAAEALAERGNAAAARTGGVNIRKALAEADTGRAGAPRKSGELTVAKKESEKVVVYVTTDRAGVGLHRSYVAK